MHSPQTQWLSFALGLLLIGGSTAIALHHHADHHAHGECQVCHLATRPRPRAPPFALLAA